MKLLLPKLITSYDKTQTHHSTIVAWAPDVSRWFYCKCRSGLFYEANFVDRAIHPSHYYTSKEWEFVRSYLILDEYPTSYLPMTHNNMTIPHDIEVVYEL